MVAPAFGFSVGDFIAGTKLLNILLDSFKESGGASSKFASEAVFLSSLVSTVKHLSDYIQNTPQDGIAEEVVKLVDVIKEPLTDFKRFLDKHEAALGKQPSKSGLEKVKSTIKYTVKDASGKIEKLRRQVEQPLQAQDQLAKIVEAIRAADVPTELQKQIDVLQNGLDVQNVQNDYQLKRIKDMRDSLTGQLDALENTLEETKALVINNKSNQQPTVQQEHGSSYSNRSTLEEALSDHNHELEAAMREQTRLLLALKSFLEEKVAMQQHIVDNSITAGMSRRFWPSATLPTAHMATVLVSALVSSFSAANSKTRGPRMDQTMPTQTLAYSNHVQVPSRPKIIPFSSRSTTVTKTNNAPEIQPIQSEASRWVSAFTRDTGSSTFRVRENLTPTKPTPSVFRTRGEQKFSPGKKSSSPDAIDPGEERRVAGKNWNKKMSGPDKDDSSETTTPRFGHAGPITGRSASGSWYCPDCGATNSDLTPDCCPICGSARL
ncbi:hypothetical protein SLS60_001858 [Paraconiothyrium brasiliense]|uniref:RanBP2-type domain-containing protein n=1 Tax=Paraconiothyrium brasiliense TaxID=300254 RepID=A0ABR3S0J3_9PLEO